MFCFTVSSCFCSSNDLFGLNVSPFSFGFMYSFMNPTGVDITGSALAIASSVVSDVVSVSDVVTYTSIRFR